MPAPRPPRRGAVERCPGGAAAQRLRESGGSVICATPCAMRTRPLRVDAQALSPAGYACDALGSLTTVPMGARRVSTERPRLSVVGTGYLGATHAVCMVELGYEVIGLDVDDGQDRAAAGGQVPFFEPELPELLASTSTAARLRFTTSYAEVARVRRRALRVRGDAAAPGRARRRPHLRRGRDRRRCADISTRKVLVVGKSTVPAGTAVRMQQLLARQAPGAGRRAGVESGVPARGLRRGRHAAAGPAGVRRALRVGRAADCGPRSRR